MGHAHLFTYQGLLTFHFDGLSVLQPTLGFPTVMNLAIWTFVPCLLLAKFPVISPTPWVMFRRLPQHPFAPNLLFYKAIQRYLEIEALAEMVYSNLFVIEFCCLLLWNQFTKLAEFNFLWKVFVWGTRWDAQSIWPILMEKPILDLRLYLPSWIIFFLIEEGREPGKAICPNHTTTSYSITIQGLELV